MRAVYKRRAPLTIDVRQSNNLVRFKAEKSDKNVAEISDIYSLRGWLAALDFDVLDDVSPLVGLLQSGEDHLSAGNVLLRVEQILEQGLPAPDDTFILIGRAVVESRHRARSTSNQSV